MTKTNIHSSKKEAHAPLLWKLTNLFCLTGKEETLYKSFIRCPFTRRADIQSLGSLLRRDALDTSQFFSLQNQE